MRNGTYKGQNEEKLLSRGQYVSTYLEIPLVNILSGRRSTCGNSFGTWAIQRLGSGNANVIGHYVEMYM